MPELAVRIGCEEVTTDEGERRLLCWVATAEGRVLMVSIVDPADYED